MHNDHDHNTRRRLEMHLSLVCTCSGSSAWHLMMSKLRPKSSDSPRVILALSDRAD